MTGSSSTDLRRSSSGIPRFHVVTDDDVLGDPGFPAVARTVLEAGGPGLALHLRGPHRGGRFIYEMARTLADAVEGTGALLVVNDRVDVLLATDLTAVHLGGRSLDPATVRGLVGPDVLIGCSTHDAEEVEAGVAGGADYLAFGNVYATPSHPGRDGVGAKGLEGAVAAAGDTPLLAIGGVTPRRTEEVRGIGAFGVAVMRGVWDAPDPAHAVREYISALGEGAEADSTAGRPTTVRPQAQRDE